MGTAKRRRKHQHTCEYERNERTIHAAILTLLKKHRGHIRVRQVAKAANVTRQTFYNHHHSTNEAIISSEAELIRKFNVELDRQLDRLSKVIPNQNSRAFYTMLHFMAKYEWIFCPICRDVNNQGLLYQIVQETYPKLEITWLPVGTPPPDLGSERYDAYIDRCVGIVRRWGKATSCNAENIDDTIKKLLRATADAERNR